MIPNELLVLILSFLAPIENVKLLILSKEIKDLVLSCVLTNYHTNLDLVKFTKGHEGIDNWVKIERIFSTNFIGDKRLFSLYQTKIGLFRYLLRFIENRRPSEQKYFKECFFKNYLQCNEISPHSCECEFILFVGSGKYHHTKSSIIDHYLFCPKHKCFLNFHSLSYCHFQVFKTIIDPINPVNPVFFCPQSNFQSFKELTGTLTVYNS